MPVYDLPEVGSINAFYQDKELHLQKIYKLIFQKKTKLYFSSNFDLII